MNSVFLKYIFCFFLVVIIHYSVGYLVERILKLKLQGVYQSHFFRLLTGVFAMVFVIAIIYSGGNTVMLGLLIPFLFLLWQKNKVTDHDAKQTKFSLSSVIVLLFGGLLIFLIQYFSIYNCGEFPILPDGDTLFYSNVSNYLGKFKIESLSLDFLQIEKHGCEPYHFFDIWINTYCKDFLGTNSFLTFKLIVYPLSILLIFLGYSALAEQAGFYGIKIYLLSFFFIFFSGLYFSFFEQSKYLADAVLFYYNTFTYPKICFVFILLQAAVLCYYNGWRNSAVILFSTLPLLFITLLPAVAITVFFIGVRSFYKSRKMLGFIRDISAFAVIVFFIAIFYFLQPKAETVNTDKFSDVLSSFVQWSYYLEMINIIGLTLIQNAIVYVAVLAIILMTFSFKEIINAIFNNELVFAALLIFFSALFCWAFFHKVMDTVQLFFNISIPLIAAIFFVIYLEALKRFDANKKLVAVVLIIAVLGFRIYQFGKIVLERENLYSTTYLKATSALVIQNFSHGGFLFDDSNYNTAFSKNANFRIRGSYLVYANSDYFCYSLTFPKLNDNAISYKSSFVKFAEQQKKSGTFRSLAQSRLDFIDNYKINHVFLTGEVIIDSLLQSRITGTITDSKTGERFCSVKHKVSKVAGF